MKTQTDKTFERYAKQYLKEEIKEIERTLNKKLQKALLSGAIPEYWKESGNRYLSRAIIDSFCQDRPYKPVSSQVLKDSNNLHLFINLNQPIMTTLKGKSEKYLKEELRDVNAHISFLENFIKNLNDNIVFIGRDHTGKLRDKSGYKKLTNDEIKNKKPLWLKNNTESLIKHLKLKGELEKELKNRYKKGIEKACVHLKSVAPANCEILLKMIK